MNLLEAFSLRGGWVYNAEEPVIRLIQIPQPLATS